jgi:hypothetical protein
MSAFAGKADIGFTWAAMHETLNSLTLLQRYNFFGAQVTPPRDKQKGKRHEW